NTRTRLTWAAPACPLPRLRSSARGARGRPSWYPSAARGPASGVGTTARTQGWFVRRRLMCAAGSTRASLAPALSSAGRFAVPVVDRLGELEDAAEGWELAAA